MEYVRTIIAALLGGVLFYFINAPLPWTLGPIVVVALIGLVRKRPMVWSLRIRNVALVLLGYAMGRPFTIATLQAILDQLPLMLLATFVTVCAGIFTGWLMYRKTGLNFTSCLLGCVPGGLSQMVVLAAEMEDVDLTAVTIMQTLRMLAVVFTIPFLTIHMLSDGPVDGGAEADLLPAADMTTMLMFALVAIAGAVVGKKIHLPTATMLGPILATAGFVIATGMTAPAVPQPLLYAAQLCVGAFIGISVELQRIVSYHGMGPVLLGGVLLVLAVSMGMGTVVAMLTGETFATAFLSTAPGGLTEMGITALTVGANISTMTAYQLTRLLFIMLVFPYVAKGIVAFYEKRIIK
ncbi:hypothetical protein SAMN02910356_01390 [Selenomonas sp. GACV-9]|uniref:AbrB family transcriptional regulator n=1 Tax=Selenomonas sp. GACV-9 TaxID=3158782 RepID=UPI0008F1A6FE|nr:hypothetical protein SAMN02910356_01390 [Selenomonas ruminantium]